MVYSLTYVYLKVRIRMNVSYVDTLFVVCITNIGNDECFGIRMDGGIVDDKG